MYSLGNLFANPESFDLHVLETSTAVDNGTATNAPTGDYEGNSRPSGSGYDIGGHEYRFGPGTANERGDGGVGCLHLYPYSQPIIDAVLVTYTLDRPCCAKLTIYDRWGRQIRLLTAGRQSPGNYQLTWDGRDDERARVRRGSYICQLNVARLSISRRIIMLHEVATTDRVVPAGSFDID